MVCFYLSSLADSLNINDDNRPRTKANYGFQAFLDYRKILTADLLDDKSRFIVASFPFCKIHVQSILVWQYNISAGKGDKSVTGEEKSFHPACAFDELTAVRNVTDGSLTLNHLLVIACGDVMSVSRHYHDMDVSKKKVEKVLFVI